MPRFSIKLLLTATHLAVFLFTALFVGFSTYSMTKEYVERHYFPFGQFPQLSEKAAAEGATEYFVYERREVLAERPGNLNKERVTGLARNLITNEEHIIYSFVDDPLEEKFQRTVPTATLLGNGLIFLRGVSDLGYAVLDVMGSNVTTDYPLLRSRDFPLAHALFGDEGQLIYTYRGENSREKDGTHRVYVQSSTKNIQALESSAFPSGKFWLKPLGWRLRNREFYVERQSDESTFAKLWKVSLVDSKAAPLHSVAGALTSDVRVCAASDLAVFVASPLNPTIGEFGQKTGPSRLLISDLRNDIARPIFSSEHRLEDLWLSCGGNFMLVKEQNDYHLFELSGKHLRTIFLEKPVAVSQQSSIVVTRDPEGRLSLLNVKTGDNVLLTEDPSEFSHVRYTVLGMMSQ